jgi:hypothetical protein
MTAAGAHFSISGGTKIAPFISILCAFVGSHSKVMRKLAKKSIQSHHQAICCSAFIVPKQNTSKNFAFRLETLELLLYPQIF